MEPEGSSPHSQELATFPCPELDQFSPCPHPTSWKSILILASIYVWVFQEVSFPQVSPPKPCNNHNNNNIIYYYFI